MTTVFCLFKKTRRKIGHVEQRHGKHRKTQNEFQEMKTAMFIMRNRMDGMNSRLFIAEEKINEHEQSSKNSNLKQP